MAVGHGDVRSSRRGFLDEIEDHLGASLQAARGALESFGEEARRLETENRSLRVRLGIAASEAERRVNKEPAAVLPSGDAAGGAPTEKKMLPDSKGFSAVVPDQSVPLPPCRSPVPLPQDQPWLTPGAVCDVEEESQLCTVMAVRERVSEGDHGEDPDSPDGAESTMSSQKSVDSGGQAEVSPAGPRPKVKFEILPMYNTNANFKKVLKSGRTTNVSRHTGDEIYYTADETEECVFRGESPLARKCVVHPYDGRRVAYDICSLILVFYDAIVIPLQMMEMPTSAFILAMQWVTRMFWSVDMPMTCVTGFVRGNGNLEMRPAHILKRYATTWLALDLLIVGVDWTELAVGDGGSSAGGVARLGKFGRAFRLIRMLRLLRMLRMGEVLMSLCERIQNESMVIGVNIGKIMGVIAFLAHLKGCFWATVGGFDPSGETWLTNTGYDLLSFPVRYTVSLHWSLSQFTGGMDEVTPAPSNLPERVYAIASWFLAFTLSSFFLSGLTSSMTQLYMLASADQKRIQTLRKYLHKMEITKGLTARVQRNAQHALKEQNRAISTQNVELLSYVSDPLRVELHYEMYGPMLSVHPFFQRYTDECPQIMRKVCHNCVKIALVSPGDVIFHTGERPSRPQMYLVLSGTVQYVSEAGKVTTVGQGHWISEAVLWTSWTHQGVLTVTSDGRMCTVDAQHFHDIVSQFQHRDFSPKVYAMEFVERLNDESELSDLLFCDEVQPELVDPPFFLKLATSHMIH